MSAASAKIPRNCRHNGGSASCSTILLVYVIPRLCGQLWCFRCCTSDEWIYRVFHLLLGIRARCGVAKEFAVVVLTRLLNVKYQKHAASTPEYRSIIKLNQWAEKGCDCVVWHVCALCRWLLDWEWNRDLFKSHQIRDFIDLARYPFNTMVGAQYYYSSSSKVDCGADVKVLTNGTNKIVKENDHLMCTEHLNLSYIIHRFIVSNFCRLLLLRTYDAIHVFISPLHAAARSSVFAAILCCGVSLRLNANFKTMRRIALFR